MYLLPVKISLARRAREVEYVKQHNVMTPSATMPIKASDSRGQIQRTGLLKRSKAAVSFCLDGDIINVSQLDGSPVGL